MFGGGWKLAGPSGKNTNPRLNLSSSFQGVPGNDGLPGRPGLTNYIVSKYGEREREREAEVEEERWWWRGGGGGMEGLGLVGSLSTDPM